VAFPNTSADPWGMYKRQCVSYTAWKVWKSGRYLPFWGGYGNANQWDDNARQAGIPVDGNPRVGDVAVSNSGYYGHVMYVEAVYGDGTIYVSQYNANWGGTYSEARVSIGSLVFIHF
jgi:peptidoglycan DL-endopeptidase CwlO